MNKKLPKSFHYRYAAITLILFFTLAQFVLILRHKSPYLSDGQFYRHTLLELRGHSFQSARNEVLKNIDLEKEDEISRNFYENEQEYRNSYTFFQKRPLYPFSAYLISTLGTSDYFSLLVPIFLAYMSSVLLVYWIFAKALKKFYSILSTALFISFFPFLDWSTYFLTDTIGLAFWLGQLILIYKFIQEGKSKWLSFYLALLIVSLLNREQSLLMLPLLLLVLIFQKIYNFPKKQIKSTLKILLPTALIVLLYSLVLRLLNLPNIYDTILYTQNSYGLYSNQYTPKETITYLINQIYISHVAAIKDIVTHHWWSLFSVLSVISVIYVFLIKRSKNLLNVIIFSSGLASYASIFIYPVLSYRYFFPVVIFVVYFSMKLTKSFFKENDKYNN